MLGHRGRCQSQQLDDLADAEFMIFQGSEDPDSVLVGDGFGDGGELPEHILTSSIRHMANYSIETNPCQVNNKTEIIVSRQPNVDSKELDEKHQKMGLM